MKIGSAPFGNAFGLVGAVLAMAGGGHTTPARAAEPLSSGWEFTVAPYLWGAGLDGNARVGRIKTDVDVSFADIIENFSLGGNIHLEARKERFGVYADPLFIRIRDNADVGPVNVRVTNDTFILAAGVFYRVLDLALDDTSGGGTRRFWVEPLAGARLTYLRLELDPNKGLPQADRSETWADPIVGARTALDLTEHWTVLTEGDFGGFGAGSNFTWNAQGFLGYRMSIAGHPTLLGAGYRALSWDYKSGDFKWDVIQDGPIIGAALRL